MEKLNQYNILLGHVINTAIKAGNEILKVRNSIDINARLKQNHTYVTDADMNANKVIMEQLNLLNLNNHAIVSEESLIPERLSKHYVWLIDPLDGTSEFVRGGDEFTVNIALTEGGEVVLGVVYVPVTNELYFAHKEIGSYKYVGEKLNYTDLLKSSTKLPYTTTEKYTIVASKLNLDKATSFFIENLSEGKDVEYANRSSSLKICMVAEGNADIYPRFNSIFEWDTAAAHAIVKFAGKNIYDMYGEELQYNKESLRNPFFIVK